MDNRYFRYNCPPLMNDGRFVSNYIRSSTFDQYIRNVNDINSSSKYRQFLQSNGDKILNNMKSYYRESSVCKIEGKCLPMSGPSKDDMVSYLQNNQKQDNWTDLILNQNNTNQNTIPEPAQNVPSDQFTAARANAMAEQLYQQMLYEQEQNKLNTDKECTYCVK